MKTPSKNIYWRDIEKACILINSPVMVEETENLFIVRFKGRGRRPAVAYWMGEEAREAQAKLKEFARKTEQCRMTKKQLIDKWLNDCTRV